MEISRPNPQDRVLNSTVAKLDLVSLFTDISCEMLYPITPIFLTAYLGTSMASLGLIEGFAEFVASLLKTHVGHWSDQLGRRKPFVVWGYLLSGIAKPLIGFSNSWSQVLFVRAFDRTGKGLRGAPRDAMLAESVSANQRGAAFGWHRAMGLLWDHFGPAAPFIFAASGAVLAAMLLHDLFFSLLQLFSQNCLTHLRDATMITRCESHFRYILNYPALARPTFGHN